ncbi:MAG: substrate-binding periplasmic protein [Cellvibrionaceae bacterium]
MDNVNVIKVISTNIINANIKTTLVALLCSCALFYSSINAAQTIRLVTEHYPPYNIDLSLDEENKRSGIGGASTEIVIEMIRRSKYPYTLELLPWKRAYGSAQEKAFTGVFSTTRNSAREKLFKWVGPIANNNYVLFSTRERNIQLSRIEEASIYSIGAYRDSAGEGLIKELGLQSELVRSDHLNVLKLARNRIDLWVSGNLYGPYLAKQYGVSNLQEAYTLREAQMYVAFNLNTPDSVIERLNGILDTMRTEGFLESVYQRYR